MFQKIIRSIDVGYKIGDRKMKKKNIFLALMMVFTLGLLAACNDAADVEDDAEVAGTEESRSLVIYSNSVTDERIAWLEEQASEAGFDLTVVSIGGGDLPNRLISERNNPIADVVFGLNHIGFETLKANDVLTPFVPSWADEIPEGWNDVDGYYHSTVQQAIMLVFNEAVLDADTAPTDWTDLWEQDAFHGEYFINNSLGGGTIRVALSGILTRYMDEDGRYGISDEGWDAMRAYFDNAVIGAGDDFFLSLANEDTSIATIWTGGILDREEQYGVSVGIVRPEIGVPFVVEQIGIVNGTENEVAAQEFVEWFGSAEIQSLWAQEFYQLPANLVAFEDAPAELVELHDGLIIQEIDWEFVTENIDNWITKIELEIME